VVEELLELGGGGEFVGFGVGVANSGPFDEGNGESAAAGGVEGGSDGGEGVVNGGGFVAGEGVGGELVDDAGVVCEVGECDDAVGVGEGEELLVVSGVSLAGRGFACAGGHVGVEVEGEEGGEGGVSGFGFRVSGNIPPAPLQRGNSFEEEVIAAVAFGVVEVEAGGVGVGEEGDAASMAVDE
jgi:hypothetical protein